ncbi:MAG: hypothetical protein HZC11_02720 [Nitrospirae bacterium]|nr:hypothetical protein [Nitrospirota bacterium]
MRKKKLFIFAVLIVNILMVSQMSWATASANLTYLETRLPNGWYLYDYTASNTSTAEEKLADIGLYYGSSYNGQDSWVWLTTPTGWINWESTGYYDSTYTDVFAEGEPVYSNTNYILAGNSLPGFSFKTNYPAGDIDFGAYFVTSTEELSYTSGVTSGTAVVPEPVSAILFLSGVTTMAVRRYLKIKKTPA